MKKIIAVVLFLIVATSLYVLSDYKPFSGHIMNEIIIFITSTMCGLSFYYMGRLIK